jgi:hypothetical protein
MLPSSGVGHSIGTFGGFAPAKEQKKKFVNLEKTFVKTKASSTKHACRLAPRERLVLAFGGKLPYHL